MSYSTDNAVPGVQSRLFDPYLTRDVVIQELNWDVVTVAGAGVIPVYWIDIYSDYRILIPPERPLAQRMQELLIIFSCKQNYRGPVL